MKHIKLLFLTLIITFYSVKSFPNNTFINQLQEGGKIIIIRHAYAPGSGDPDKFLIKDCSTQRNLNNKGIRQAKLIGNFFMKNKIPIDQVLSSEWCRCKDTAFYAFKKFKTISSLNSFYDIQFQKNKDNQINELKNLIKNWKSQKNIILITHFVVINELLNASAISGEIIISDKKFNILGRMKNSL